MVSLLGKDLFTIDHVPGKSLTIIEERDDDDKVDDVPTTSNGTPEDKKRVLHLVNGNLLDTKHIHFADVVMLETDFPEVSASFSSFNAFIQLII